MRLYNILYLVQDAYNALNLHHCEANAFEIAYLQERQKLNEVLEANKELGLRLEYSQSTIDHYEQKLLPDFLCAPKDALVSKLEILQEDSTATESMDLRKKSGEYPQNKQVATDDIATSTLQTPRTKKRQATSEQGADLQERGTMNGPGKSNREKLRRLAKAELSEAM